MKRQFIALVLSALVAAPALAANRSMGSHGMVLFGGREALYASHLPMFHPPHDYQVTLQLRLADKKQDALLRARLNGKAELWTLDPEKFELDRFAPGAARPLRRFNADLVLGHFEQGGKTQYAQTAVIVEKVLYFRQLKASMVLAPTARYLQFGAGRQRFLVKLIDSRPDSDHIIAVRTSAGASSAEMILPKSALAQPPAHSIEQKLPRASVVGTVYFSTDDLR